MINRIHNLHGFTSTVDVPDVTPDVMYSWLRAMDNEQFKLWHDAHLEYRVLKETENIVGSRFYFHEVISGFHIKGTWKILRADTPGLLVFKRVGLPIYWLLSLRAIEKGTRVTNEMRYGTGWRILDKLLIGMVHRWVLTPETRQAIDEHDREEFLMLSTILGKDQVGSSE